MLPGSLAHTGDRTVQRESEYSAGARAPRRAAAMGKVAAKLSRAMRREMEVRRQLGVNPSWHRLKGRRGRTRAAEELERRRRAKRRTHAGWNDISAEIQDCILRNVSLGDLQSVRLAGLYENDLAAKARMAAMMKRRVSNVRKIWEIWERGTPKYHASVEREKCRPIEFTTKVTKLVVSPGFAGLPDGINEMKELRILDISRSCNAAYIGIPSAIDKLPHSLANCKLLVELKMSWQKFEEIPPCVLELKNLRKLDVEHNKLLRSLPKDLGRRLKRLRYIGIRGCEKVKELPASLLTQLNAAQPYSFALTQSRVPMMLTKSYFPLNYLEHTFDADKYPNLHSFFHAGCIAEMGPFDF